MIDIFYNEIINEARNGRIDCFGIYNIIFNTNIEGNKIEAINSNPNLIIPTLNISNKVEFDNVLQEYVIKAINFYDKNNFFEEIRDNETLKQKTLMTILWSNATYEDFNNPVLYIKNRISFLENNPNINVNSYLERLDSTLNIETAKSNIMDETPYCIKMKLLNGNNSFELPYIYLGINGNTAYVYAVKNNKKQVVTTYSKQINRLLYKVNDGLDVKEDTFDNYGFGNLKDITPSFLLTVNAIVGLLHENGIENVVVPSILVERWNAKEIFFDYKREMLSKKYSKESVDKALDDLKDEHDRIQSNLTEKLLRVFRRLEFHHTAININNYPSEQDSRMF